MSAKEKEGTYRPLVDDYLHSWYVVHVDMKKHRYLQSTSKIQLHTKKNLSYPHTNLVHQNLTRME